MRSVKHWRFLVVLTVLSVFALAQTVPNLPGFPSNSSSSSGSSAASYWYDAGVGYIFASEGISNPDGGVGERIFINGGSGSSSLRAALGLYNTAGSLGGPSIEFYSGGTTTASRFGVVYGSQASNTGQIAGLNLYGATNVAIATAGTGPGTGASLIATFTGTGITMATPSGQFAFTLTTGARIGISTSLYFDSDNTDGRVNGGFQANNFKLGTRLTLSGTAPTVSSGFGTSPSITAGVSAAFRLNVGTGGTASSGVIGLPTAANGWNCQCADITTQSANVFLCKQIASSTTSATITNYNTAGVATAWSASDILAVTCTAF